LDVLLGLFDFNAALRASRRSRPFKPSGRKCLVKELTLGFFKAVRFEQLIEVAENSLIHWSKDTLFILGFCVFKIDNIYATIKCSTGRRARGTERKVKPYM
jgi:hypothetical protein